MAFKYGDKTTNHFFPATDCDTQTCKQNFSNYLQGQACGGKWGRWTRHEQARSQAARRNGAVKVQNADPLASRPGDIICKPSGPIPPIFDETKAFYTSDNSQKINPDIGLGDTKHIDQIGLSFGRKTMLAATGVVYAVQGLSTTIADSPYFSFSSTYGLSITRDGKSDEFDTRSFFPAAAVKKRFSPYGGSVADLNVYGALDDSTGKRHPKVFTLNVSADMPLEVTGFGQIDEDRQLKVNGQRVRHDGDLLRDGFAGRLVFANRPGNPYCIIGATVTGPTDAMGIKATGGTEYFFNLGPNQFPPWPKLDEINQNFAQAANAYILSVVRDAENLPCLDHAAAKKLLYSLPPGCGDGSRKQVFQ